MADYPLFVNLQGARVVLVGGGKVGLQKARSLAGRGAKLTLVSPQIDASLLKLLRRERARVLKRAFRAADLKGAQLVFAATSSRQVNREIGLLARRQGIWVAVADAPGEGNFVLPALAKAGPLRLAISTSGASPALAKQVRLQLEAQLKRSPLPWLIGELGRLRPRLKARPGALAAVSQALSRPALAKGLLQPATPAFSKKLKALLSGASKR